MVVRKKPITRKRGFQLLSKEKRVEIARLGGYARHANDSKKVVKKVVKKANKSKKK